MSTRGSLERVQAWKPFVPGIREVFHARFVDHAYPRPTHDTWTLFIVDEGVIRYDLERREHGALPPMVSIHPQASSTTAGRQAETDSASA
ncbi:MAG: AraC family ligand binding domain-containing protein [Acidimicrobiia bacterium]